MNSQSEISNDNRFQIVLLSQQYIARLHVSMQDAQSMKMPHSAQHLLQHGRHFLVSQRVVVRIYAIGAVIVTSILR